MLHTFNAWAPDFRDAVENESKRINLELVSA
jgi:hypothetical protein